MKVLEQLDSEQLGPGSDQVDFNFGETINQTRTFTLSDGTEHTETAKGTVAGWNNADNIVSYVQDARYHTDDNGVLYRFKPTEKIVTKRELTFPNERDKEVTIDISFNETYLSQTFVMGQAEPELVKYTGEMTYLTNLSPIKRQPTQTERVSLIISY